MLHEHFGKLNPERPKDSLSHNINKYIFWKKLWNKCWHKKIFHPSHISQTTQQRLFQPISYPCINHTVIQHYFHCCLSTTRAETQLYFMWYFGETKGKDQLYKLLETIISFFFFFGGCNWEREIYNNGFHNTGNLSCIRWSQLTVRE